MARDSPPRMRPCPVRVHTPHSRSKTYHLLRSISCQFLQLAAFRIDLENMPKGQLHWQPGFSLTRKPAKKAIARRKAVPAKGANPRQYEFICEYPVGSGTQGPINPTGSGIFTTIPPQEDVPIAPATYRRAGSYNSQTSPEVDSASLSPNCPSPRNSKNDTSVLEDSERTPLERIDGWPADCAEDTIQERAVLPWLGSTIPDLTNTRGHNYTYLPTPSAILYNNTGHRFQPVLDRCMIPHFS